MSYTTILSATGSTAKQGALSILGNALPWVALGGAFALMVYVACRVACGSNSDSSETTPSQEAGQPGVEMSYSPPPLVNGGRYHMLGPRSEGSRSPTSQFP
jgi:hypothetical protein